MVYRSNSNPLEIKDKINIILVINQSITHKKWHTIQFNRERIYAKRYGFLSFAKNMRKNIGKNINKSLNCKYSQKLLDHAKQSATDAFKTSSKRVMQKTAETTSDLIGNKLAYKITRSRKSSPQNNLETNEEILKDKYISPELRQKIINDLRIMKD